MATDMTSVIHIIECIDWSSFFTTLFGAGFGAISAYGLNFCLEWQKQKQHEKTRMLKLFYDLSILAKCCYEYYKNVYAIVRAIKKGTFAYTTPISIDSAKLDIQDYGFITESYPLLYEMLTYVQYDFEYLISEDSILSNIDMSYKDAYLDQLESIKIFIPKLVAKIYTSLLNVNGLLMKKYNTKNLIKDKVLNAIKRTTKLIYITKKAYINAIKNKTNNQRYLETFKSDLWYIDDILKTWLIDFKLKKIFQKEIDDIRLKYSVDVKVK